MCFPVNIANFLRTAFFIELVAASEFLTKLVEDNCGEDNCGFSQKFLRNHFLVLAATFLKMTHLQAAFVFL